MGQCGTGKEQSPIDIVKSNVKDEKGLKVYMSWNPNPKTVFLQNKVYFVQADGNWMVFISMHPDGKVRTWEAVQFHFHYRGEHTIDGVTYDAELHIVCAETPESQSIAGDKRNLAAFGFLFKISNNDNPLFQ